MIYITGDCHADFRRFSTEEFPEQKEMTKEDYVIICGDFGGVWHYKNSHYWKKDQYWLDWLEEKPFTTLFVDGNHENFDCLYAYPEEKWKGGTVHKVRPSVLHLKRGEIFEIDGKKIFAFGGAASHDISAGILEMDEEGTWRTVARQMDKEGKLYRIKNLTWWERELPTKNEMENALLNLEEHQWEVDYVVSHCCPQQAAVLLGGGRADVLTNFFDEIADKLKFKKWYFGHYHDNRQIMCSYVLLYQEIIRIV